jgi:RimJ/RimL family protein N-acetyltransferase
MTKSTPQANFPRADIQIRALELDDWKQIIAWRRDEGTWDVLVGQRRFVSTETEKAWVARVIEQHAKGEVLRFGITVGDCQDIVGMYIVSDIDRTNRSCAYGNILSPLDARGRGIASSAGLLVFTYLFNEMGMHRVVGRILESNLPSRRFAERFGFVQEGVLREAVFKNGRFQNLLMYAMLRDDFYHKHGDTLRCSAE